MNLESIKFWTGDLTIKWGGLATWHVYCTVRLANDACFSGTLQRSGTDLSEVIDGLIANAKDLSVSIGLPNVLKPSLLLHAEGEDPEYPAPENWRQVIQDQCDRLGWTNIYANSY